MEMSRETLVAHFTLHGWTPIEYCMGEDDIRLVHLETMRNLYPVNTYPESTAGLAAWTMGNDHWWAMCDWSDVPIEFLQAAYNRLQRGMHYGP